MIAIHVEHDVQVDPTLATIKV